MTQIDKQTLLDIFAAIRKSFAYRSPHYQAVLRRVRTDELGPRGGARYRCDECQESYGRKDIQIDHIEPVVPVGMQKSSMSPEDFYQRCFVTPEQLQSLCKLCHRNKSLLETKERVSMRRKRKV